MVAQVVEDGSYEMALVCLGLIANEASAIRDMSLFIVKNITHQRNQWGVDAPPSSSDDDSSGDDESEEEEETAPNKEKGSSSRRMEQLLAHLRSMQGIEYFVGSDYLTRDEMGAAVISSEAKTLSISLQKEQCVQLLQQFLQEIRREHMIVSKYNKTAVRDKTPLKPRPDAENLIIERAKCVLRGK